MTEEKKCNCGMPLNADTECKCELDTCAICCKCPDGCECDCGPKADKIKADNEAEEKR